MTKVKPALPKGMRDFGPDQMARRNYIVAHLREVFERFGFLPLETPAMEKLETLTGKYGEEGDKLIFKVLNSGDFLKKADREAFETHNLTRLAQSIAEKGLRYDLTIPFARYVAMNQGRISFPFRRYQMQPVWRADRPQKGRYREFVQCDVDVIGSTGLLSEAELIQIYQMAFASLNMSIRIRVNNRKILEGLAGYLGVENQFTALTVALDKLDKVGMAGIRPELAARGLLPKAILDLEKLIEKRSWSLDQLGELLNNERGQEGIAELRRIFSFLPGAARGNVEFDLTLARGLDYYTGTIFEVTAEGVEIGSVGGGGRYDDLTGVFGLPGMSGVGISFGLDRIYDVMEELELFPENMEKASQVLFVNFGGEAEAKSFEMLTRFRLLGLRCEMYPEAAKMKKQMKYANARRIPFVIMLGEEEIKSSMLQVKDMQSGSQTLSTEAGALEMIRAALETQ